MAAVRLHRLKTEYRERVAIVWRSFPLIPQNTQREFTPYIAKHWKRAGEEEPSIKFSPWPEKVPMPSASMPALVAAKCARLQSEAAFDQYHMAVFRAYFEQGCDISEYRVLLALAEETALDRDRFAADFEGEPLRQAILMEQQDARTTGDFSGIPTTFIGGRFMLEGAVPVELYRRGVELVAHGEQKEENES